VVEKSGMYIDILFYIGGNFNADDNTPISQKITSSDNNK
jgi:hypothetical protein